MKKVFCLVLFFLFFGAAHAWAATEQVTPRAGHCEHRVPTADTDDYYVYAGGRDVKVMVEPDTSGAGTTYIATISICTGKEFSANSCEIYLWDADDDSSGIDEESTLDGDSYKQRAIYIEKVAGGVYVNSTTGPGVGETPEVVMCLVE